VRRLKLSLASLASFISSSEPFRMPRKLDLAAQCRDEASALSRIVGPARYLFGQAAIAATRHHVDRELRQKVGDRLWERNGAKLAMKQGPRVRIDSFAVLKLSAGAKKIVAAPAPASEAPGSNRTGRSSI
jgi:hypothetical protein